MHNWSVYCIKNTFRQVSRSVHSVKFQCCCCVSLNSECYIVSSSIFFLLKFSLFALISFLIPGTRIFRAKSERKEKNNVEFVLCVSLWKWNIYIYIQGYIDFNVESFSWEIGEYKIFKYLNYEILLLFLLHFFFVFFTFQCFRRCL